MPTPEGFDIVVSSPPVGCDFVRNGGEAPVGLRRLRVNGPVGEHPSDPSNPAQQLTFIYEAESSFRPGVMELVNYLAEGTFSIGAPAGGVVHVTVGAESSHAHVTDGSFDATVCE